MNSQVYIWILKPDQTKTDINGFKYGFKWGVTPVRSLTFLETQSLYKYLCDSVTDLKN